ncbi:DUF5682 family protein [Deinococcus altitudinis]|uniref:DUF5682 family protein n=1 Tax=Deinococcus altitudinis TaxID=468914 RepID=UPI003891F72E
MLTVYPIRHHGPGSARSLERSLEANPPALLLIEGPADATELLSFLSSPDMQPPVALMAHVIGSPEQAVFYPLAAFSPEFVAMRWALARGIPARFMDLPAAVTLAQAEAEVQEARARLEATPEPESEVQPDVLEVSDEPATPIGPEAVLRSDPLSALAQAAGFTDFERWWETLVEARGDDAEVFGAVSEVMEAVREDSETAERDVLREAQMRQCIREALKGGGPVAVVCGAWHAPALTPAVLEREKKADPLRLKGLPKIKTALTWVPWTHGRLTMASGYGAGIQSPGWYAHLFAGRPDVSAEWLTRSARMLREAKLDASSAQVIDAVRLGEALAAIRGLGLPGLPELNDATQAVFGWDSGLPLRLLHERLIVGETLGGVPEGVPSVPLAQDLAAIQKRLRIKPEATSKELILDLREENDLARSQLLHRLTLLNIPWGAPAEVRGTGTFKEGWTLRWEPEFAVRVVEATLHGNTLVRAANTRAAGLARQAATLGELSELLEVCRLAQLPDAARVTLQALDTRAAVASDVTELLGALPALARLARYGDVRTRGGDDPAPVFRTLMARAGAGLPNASLGLADAAAEAIQKAVARADAAVRLLADGQATGDWLAALHALDGTEQAHPLLQGDAARRLRDHGELNAAAVEARMALALSPARPAAAVSSWLDGVLGENGALLLDDPALLSLLDGWVVSLPEEAFGAVLPALRRSLSRFEAAQRREMGERVRGLERAGTVQAIDDALGMLPIPFALKLLGVNS